MSCQSLLQLRQPTHALNETCHQTHRVGPFATCNRALGGGVMLASSALVVYALKVERANCPLAGGPKNVLSHPRSSATLGSTRRTCVSPFPFPLRRPRAGIMRERTIGPSRARPIRCPRSTGTLLAVHSASTGVAPSTSSAEPLLAVGHGWMQSIAGFIPAPVVDVLSDRRRQEFVALAGVA